MIEQALKQYDLKQPQYEFIRHNENIVYKIVDGLNRYVLRIHQPVEGFSLSLYQKDTPPQAFIEGEMNVLNLIQNSSISFQKPVQNKQGALVSYLDDHIPVTMLQWIDGHHLEELTNTLAYQMGQTLSRVHSIFRCRKVELSKCKRFEYDIDLFDDIIIEIEKMKTTNQLSEKYCEIMIETCHTISSSMLELDEDELCLIHADYAKGNIIYTGSDMVPIDFSLSGNGHPYMDVGFLLSNIGDRELRKQALKGYEEDFGREIPRKYLEAFYVYGVILYIACQHDKIHNKEWFERNMKRWTKTLFKPLNEGQSFLDKI